jgi:hypothetical protein
LLLKDIVERLNFDRLHDLYGVEHGLLVLLSALQLIYLRLRKLLAETVVTVVAPCIGQPILFVLGRLYQNAMLLAAANILRLKVFDDFEIGYMGLAFFIELNISGFCPQPFFVPFAF